MKPNQCNIKPFCFHLHNVSPTPVFALYCLIKAVYNESNERCNALQVYPRPSMPVQP